MSPVIVYYDFWIQYSYVVMYADDAELSLSFNAGTDRLKQDLEDLVDSIFQLRVRSIPNKAKCALGILANSMIII